jgi:uncharacterized membrane protein
MNLEDMTPEHQAQAVKLFSFVNANPDVAKQIRRAAKEKNPTMQTPDLDLEDRLEAQAKEQREALEKLRQEQMEYVRAERRKEAHAKIRSAGLDPEAVEKVMVESSISDYDTAVNYIRAQKQLAPATPEMRSPLQMPDTKELWKDHRNFQEI